MAERIFARREGKLVSLEPTPYLSESALQTLLASHPDLMPGDEIDAESLLVAREVPLPGEEPGASTFALDNLLLDQDGVPTLVEVKRLVDTRIRREVIGQMLDYAARAVTRWTAVWMQERYTHRCGVEATDSESELTTFLGPDSEPALFWSQVQANLQRGRIRLIFLADIVPLDLRRVTEFMNSQMNPAEVFAVEIRQFAADDLQMYMPRVFGSTASTQQKALGNSRRIWNEDSFFDELHRRTDISCVNTARTILDWAKRRLLVWWGKGAKDGSFGGMYVRSNIRHYVFALYSHGTIEIYFQWLKQRPPFDNREKRVEFFDRLKNATGLTFSADAIERRPSIRLSSLASPATLSGFLAVMDWAVDIISRTASAEADE